MCKTDTALSILCGTWNLDSEEEIQMIFYENGTGEIILRHIFNAWIAAETEWKSLGPEPLDQISVSNSNTTTSQTTEAQVVAHFNLEITLTKRAITTRGSTENYILNEENLIDAAFLPKRYSVRLEKGSFKTAFERTAGPAVRPWRQSYAYQLVFDKSPYPPLNEWKDPEEAPEPPFLPFEEWREFCSRALPKDGQA
ncbi:hypothetical protein AbraIFM66951_001639 [Aspergillus brasiliensis]|uniref:Uncharacterized protein n=1 Tax=Aspergillus brasiliensis TaxID=319629 RepID=A0A9W6DME4_9EURO|nr:hypothetical protein AbraCBS73388_005223 [Aspergillus brasiliensis]GKZ49235.1 hypothetical protein AbraIFM66951_001639 [Aspergillus brasiliensis]